MKAKKNLIEPTLKTKIHITRDYNAFTIRKTNRSVVDSYVNQLMESIQKNDLTENFPIVVNDKMEIVDGQHRYFACMALGLPIKYTIIQGEFTSKEVDDITIDINTNMRIWKFKEFIHMYSQRGYPAYKRLQEFIDKYKIPASNALIIVANNRPEAKAVRDGKFKVGEIPAEEIMLSLLDIKTIFPDAMHSRFVEAFVKIYKTKLYDHKRDFKKLVLYRMDMMKCATIEQYVKMLEVILNKRRGEIRGGGKLDLITATGLKEATA